MSKSHKDQRPHRRKVAGTKKGLAEHKKRDKRRHRNKYAKDGPMDGVEVYTEHA